MTRWRSTSRGQKMKSHGRRQCERHLDDDPGQRDFKVESLALLLENLVQERAFLVRQLSLTHQAVEQLGPRPPKDALNQVAE